MKKSTWVVSLLGSVLLLSASALRAQEPPPGPGPGPDMMGPGGPIGGRMEILGFGEMHPGKVVTGAPYSAVVVIESTQTLSDGNTINRKVQTNVFRDSQGRTRRETTLPAVGPSGGLWSAENIHHDFRSGGHYRLCAASRHQSCEQASDSAGQREESCQIRRQV